MGEDFDEDELARHRAGIRIGGRGRLEEHLIPTAGRRKKKKVVSELGSCGSCGYGARLDSVDMPLYELRRHQPASREDLERFA